MVYVYLAKPEKQVFKVQIKYEKLSWENSLACLNLQKKCRSFLKIPNLEKKILPVFSLMSGNLEPQASSVILNDKRKINLLPLPSLHLDLVSSG